MNPKNNTSRGLTVAFAITAAVAVASQITGLKGFVFAILALLAVSVILTPRAGAAYANNFGVLNNMTLFHDAFTEFWKKLLPITRICLNVANEVQLDDGTTVLVRNAKPGDIITIKNWKQAFTVYTVGAGGYNTPTNVGPTDKQFTLPNAPKACSIQLTPAEFRVISGGVTGGADYDAFKKKMINGMLHAIGSQIVADFLAVFTAADYTTETVSAAGTFSRSTELALEKAFFDRDVPLDNPQIILPSTPFTEWVDSHTAIQTNTGQNVQQQLLFMGERHSLTTPFTVGRTNVAMPADADRGLAINRTAVCGAFRIPDEPTWEGDPVSLARVVDPNSGAGALVRMWKVGGGSTGAMQLDVASIWSFVKGQVEAAQRIVAEATE